MYRIRQRTSHHTPLGRYSKLDCSIPLIDCSISNRVEVSNDTSSERSRRDVSNAGLFGTDTIPTIPTIPTTVSGDIDHGKSAQGCDSVIVS